VRVPLGAGVNQWNGVLSRTQKQAVHTGTHFNSPKRNQTTYVLMGTKGRMFRSVPV